jgi:hypothetical protein
MRLGLGNRLACDLDTHWLSRADLLEVGHSKGNVVQLVSLAKSFVKPMLWFVPAIPKTH